MDFIELLKVIFLGIVEGITEWLPISSTGHLILVEEFVKLDSQQCFLGNVYGGHSAWRHYGGGCAVLE